MSEFLVLTHRLDIPVAARLSAQHPGARRVVVCPHLADRCQAEGLPVHLLKLPGSEVPWVSYRQARTVARGIQQQIDAQLAHFDPLAPGCDWLQLDLFYACYTLMGFAAIWERAIAQHPDARWLVPVPDAPFRYGSHSFLPALTLLERLGAAGRPMRAYSHSLPPWEPDVLPDLGPALADGPPDLLSHLPTCFYDAKHFEQAMLGSQRRCLNLPSPYYDVGLTQVPSLALVPAAQVEAGLPAQVIDRIDTVADAVGQTLGVALGRLMASPRFLVPQVQAMVGRLRRQMVFGASLAQHLDAQPPRTLLLSNHDASLHGPLFSFARRHRCKVLLVPHSKFFNAPVPAAPGLDIHCLTHPVQGVPVQDPAGRAVSSSALAFPEAMQWAVRPPRPLKTLGVLLSGVSYSALCCADLDRFVAGLRQVLDWCAAQGVLCRIRCKPSEPMIGLLTDSLGLPIERLLADMGGSLNDFATACDLCLSYDIPTSASVDLLRLGVPTLHALVRPLLAEEAALMDTAIVPRAMVPEVLIQLQPLAADARHLWTFGRNQFLAFARAWSGALPLDHFL